MIKYTFLIKKIIIHQIKFHDVFELLYRGDTDKISIKIKLFQLAVIRSKICQANLEFAALKYSITVNKCNFTNRYIYISL